MALRAVAAAALLLGAAAAARRHPGVRLAAEALPPEVARMVLGRVPRPPQVAWALDRRRVAWWGGVGPVAVLPDNEGSVMDIKFLPGGQRLVTADAKGTVTVWSTLSRRALRRLRSPDDGGHAGDAVLFELGVFPDGDRVVTLGSDEKAVVWSAAQGRPLRRLDVGRVAGRHRVVRVFPGGHRLLTGVSLAAHDPAVIWRVEDGAVLHTLALPQGAIVFLELSPCGAKVMAATFAEGIFLWDAASGRLDCVLPFSAMRFATATISRGAARVAGAVGSGVRLWDGRACSMLESLRLDTWVVALALVSDVGAAGERLVAVSKSEAVVFDLLSGRRLRAIRHRGEVLRAVVTTVGPLVALCCVPREPSVRQTTVVWDSATGRRIHESHGELKNEMTESHCPIALSSPRSMHEWLAPRAAS